MASEFNADDILEVSTSGYKSCPTSGHTIIPTSGPVSAFGSVIPIGS